MSKIKIDNYASVLIVPNGIHGFAEDRVLTSLYDDSYPREVFRNNINLIGGNRAKGDYSPRATLEREISEEFSGISEDQTEIDETVRHFVGEGSGAKKVTNFAPKKDIDYIRNQLLSESVPYQDFLTHVPQMGKKPSAEIMFSVFVYNSQSSKKFFEIAEKNLAMGKSLINEGLLAVTPIKDVLSGKAKCAWATGQILEDLLIKDIPNPNGIEVELLGLPRESFEDYLIDFELKPRK